MSGQIVVDGLTKVYPGVRAVDGLSFAVQPGRVTGFLGPNGSGKTTTLRMILDLVAASAGTATIDGTRYRDLPDPLRTVGAVLEASSAHRGRTGRNHLRVICTAEGYPMRRADEVLELVGLVTAGRREVKGYSLGMRQRLGIATAMLGDPQVLILDEPANGLDPVGIAWMREFLDTLARQGRTVFVSSHLLGEMEQLADDVIIIGNGQLLAQGSVDEVVGSLQRKPRVRVRTPDPDALTEQLARRGATWETEENGELVVSGVDAAEVGEAALAAQVVLHALIPQRPDLEQAFLQLTRGTEALR
jgi:ABC-2 type transport system ATP-binding protein